MLSINSKITLHNKAQLPVLGLGVWQIADGQPTVDAVSEAIQAGYRHIDTAKIYGNEAGVGAAVRASKVSRPELWITTKLWGTDQLNAPKAFESSLARLGVDYVDLYLVHWPVPGLVKRTWRTMEEIYATGRAKAVGVSNHSVSDLRAILEKCQVPPMVNQIPLSPFGFDQGLIDFCHEHKIAVEGYSPLTRGSRLNDPALREIAETHAKSAAQVLIRWGLQKGTVPLPKSANPERIKENIDVFDFELSQEQMQRLNSLNSG